MTKPNLKRRSAKAPEPGAVRSAVEKAFDDLTGKLEFPIPVDADKYEEMAWQIYLSRCGERPATSSQVRAELDEIRKTAERLSTLIKNISTPAKGLIEAQDCETTKARPKKLSLSHSICELADLWAAAVRAAEQEPSNTKGKGPAPEPLIEEMADMAARDFWRLTGNLPSRVFADSPGYSKELRGDFVEFLGNILRAVGVIRSVDAIAKGAAAKLKEELPEPLW